MAFPTFIYIAGSYFGTLPKTLRLLIDSGVLLASEEEWEKVRRFTSARLMSNPIVFLPYEFGMAAAFLTFNVTETSGPWYDAEKYIAGWLIPVHAFFLFFLLTHLGLRLYIAFLILKMLFGFKVNIQPFHPDGCGGLGSLLKQSKKLNWSMASIGVITGVAILSNIYNYNVGLYDISNVLAYASFILFAGIAFFIPLYALSASMLDAKQKLLALIDQRYRKLRERGSVANNDMDDLGNDHVADLKALSALQNTARSMRVWPFDRASLVVFVLTITIPFFIVVAFGVLLIPVV